MSAMIVSLIVILLSATAYYVLRAGRRPPGLPPGPKTVPILGNAHLFPRRHAYLQFNAWARQYGKVYSLMLLSKPAIVISDAYTAHRIVDKHSAITSDRPPIYMADLVTDGKNTILARYGPEWKRARSIIQRVLTKEAVARHEPIQRAEAVQLMYDLLVEPAHFFEHTTRYSYSLATSILAGLRSPRSTSNPLLAFDAMAVKWSSVLEPGVQPPVDVLPVLKYVPERWAKWKTLCRDVRAMQFKLYGDMIQACERRVGEDMKNGSLLETLLDDKKFGADRDLLRGTVGAFMEGAVDTTSLFLRSLILMLVAHPEVQAKAQREIDAVVGLERSPLPSDLHELPYVQAIVKEILRIRPPLPLGTPHHTTEELIVDGYVIPKNSVIFINQYSILHDLDAYDEPYAFNPDRFLQSEFGVKPEVDIEGRQNDVHFGAGRRVCVGMHLANNSLHWNTMNLLWAFTFKTAIDPITSQPIPVDINNYSEGIANAPNPFNCDIQPRSEKHARIIRQELLRARTVFEAFEYGLSEEDSTFVRDVNVNVARQM